ncbi:MAG: DUF427 domain-containing protein [Chloroflexi bacterium]|nr:DUF427 domain-containing protein [Chloroflexota bacterium]MBI3931663.1 DUF427 domain-containing protein [Chloroflexota bacterium]
MAKATWNGTTLAESDKYEVVEGNIYFPPDSVKWEYFDRGDREYTCPWKGEACYHDITVEGKTNENAAWSYPEPKPAAKNIKGHIAFELGKGIKVEK